MDNRILRPSIRISVDGGTASGLSEHGDAFGISTESGNVIADPFQRFTLVEQAEIVFGNAGGAREAEDIGSVAWWTR